MPSPGADPILGRNGHHASRSKRPDLRATEQQAKAQARDQRAGRNNQPLFLAYRGQFLGQNGSRQGAACLQRAHRKVQDEVTQEGEHEEESDLGDAHISPGEGINADRPPKEIGDGTVLIEWWAGRWASNTCHAVRRSPLVGGSGMLLVSCQRLPCLSCYFPQLVSCPPSPVTHPRGWRVPGRVGHACDTSGWKTSVGLGRVTVLTWLGHGRSTGPLHTPG